MLQLHILHENLNLINCTKSNTISVFAEFTVHISPGQPNWGSKLPVVFIQVIPIISKITSVCKRENTIRDHVHVFGLRGFPLYGHVLFNSFSSVIGTMWDMGLQVAHSKLYATLDQRQSIDTIITNQNKYDHLDAGVYTTLFQNITKDGILHNWLYLVKKSFETPICIQSISIGQTGTLDLYNYSTPANTWQRFSKFLLSILHVPQHALNHNNICTVKIISRKNNRKILNEDELIIIGQNKLPYCRFEKIDFEIMSFNKQAWIMQHETTILLGLDGTGLLNAIYMRPCSAVIRILPWGGDFFSLQNNSEYINKGINFENLARKVGCEWLSYTIAEEDIQSILVRKKSIIKSYIRNQLIKNYSVEIIQKNMKKRFSDNERLQFWKYGLNSHLDSEVFLTLIRKAVLLTKKCLSTKNVV